MKLQCKLCTKVFIPKRANQEYCCTKHTKIYSDLNKRPTKLSLSLLELEGVRGELIDHFRNHTQTKINNLGREFERIARDCTNEKIKCRKSIGINRKIEDNLRVSFSRIKFDIQELRVRVESLENRYLKLEGELK